MSIVRRESAHGTGAYGEPPQRDILRGVNVPTHIKRKPQMSGRGLFVNPQLGRAETTTRPISPEISAFFKGRDLPTDVWAPTGIAYYKDIKDIPDSLFPKTDVPPKIDSQETRAAVALQVCPPKEGEPADASFKFVGERGLYVRVILTRSGEITDGNKSTEKKERWIHYNDEAADFKNIIYT